MLGIYHEAVQEIAQMPTNHSWAAPLMQLEAYETDEAEEAIDRWIEATMHKMYPNTDLAERLVRIAWLPLLEKEAIAAYLTKHRYLALVVPQVCDVDEALMVAQAEIQEAIPEEDMEAAREFLQQMETGQLNPTYPG